eukprot:scaffold329_cov118-Skeletonema_menzelii.AAC.6
MIAFFAQGVVYDVSQCSVRWSSLSYKLTQAGTGAAGNSARQYDRDSTGGYGMERRTFGRHQCIPAVRLSVSMSINHSSQP